MRKITKNKLGFTLIEMLIAVLLSGVVITAIFQVISVSTKTNNAISETTDAVNALDNTMETIRQSIMSANSMTIGDAAVEPVPEGADIIKCVDNVIYLNDKPIGRASMYAVNRINLKFTPMESNRVLRVELECYDENDGIISGKSRTVDLYLQSLGEDGEGTIQNSDKGTNKNCIVYTTMHPSN